jgi:hypothetical protein
MFLDAENGCIQVDLKAMNDKEGKPIFATGSFLLTRACLDDDKIIWDKLVSINFLNEDPTCTLFKDFTIEQGKRYQYSL